MILKKHDLPLDMQPKGCIYCVHMDIIFDALADPTRRIILDKLHENEALSLSMICESLQMSRQGVSKHIALLEKANLVIARKRGREKLHYLNTVPLQIIYSRWITKFDSVRITALHDLKESIEKEKHMKGFVYQIVIASSPDSVWTALQQPEFTQKYWFGRKLESTWTVGADVNLVTPDGSSEMNGKILEYTPGKRLSYTWNTAHQDSETTVVFELEAFGPMTKLTIMHDINTDDKIGQMAVSGWTMILSGLKTLLETGNPLPAVQWKKP